MTITCDDIEKAHTRIKPFVHQTPVMTSRHMDDHFGAKLFFKCENFQKGGAFKARGAFNTIYSLEESQIRNGIVTHSSGNHAGAVALAAGSRGAKAYIIMPENASRAKKEAVIGYGATLINCEPNLAARDKEASRVQLETGAYFIHPYDDDRIIAGQATAAVELLGEIDNLDTIICPVGGGGLLAGTALAAHFLFPATRIIAGEPSGADDTFQSFRSRKHVAPATAPETIADGLLASLGTRNFTYLLKHVDDVLLTTDKDIVRAMQMIWQYMKVIVEPSAAVPLACLLNAPENIRGKRVGIMISGGNIDLLKLPWYDHSGTSFL